MSEQLQTKLQEQLVEEADADQQAKLSFNIKSSRIIDKNGDAIQPAAPAVETPAAPVVKIEVNQDQENEGAFKVTDNRSHDKFGNRNYSTEELATQAAAQAAKAESEAARKTAGTAPAEPAFKITDNRRVTVAGPVNEVAAPVAEIVDDSAETTSRYGRIRSKLANFSLRRAGVEAPGASQTAPPSVEAPVFGPQTEQQATESATAAAAEQAAAPAAQAQPELIIAQR